MLENNSLNKNVPIPLYFQLKKLIVNEIKKGEYQPGDKIPCETEICEIFQISRTVAHKAITELTKEGWLSRGEARSIIIAKGKKPIDLSEANWWSNKSFFLNKGAFENKTVGVSIIPMQVELGQAISDKTIDKCVAIQMKRMYAGEQIAFLEIWLPYPKCGFAMEHDFEKEDIFDVLSVDKELKVKNIRRTCEAVAAESMPTDYMPVEVGRPLFFVKTIARNEKEEVVFVAHELYLGAKAKFTISIDL